MLMPHPHAAPPRCRSASATLALGQRTTDLLLWSKSTNAPDGAGCSLTPQRELGAAGISTVSMHLMVLGAPRRWPRRPG